MKHLKGIAALLLGATLFVGCSGSSVSKTVSKTCTADIQGMTMSITITAPSEDAEIDGIEFDFDMPYSVIRDNAGPSAADLTDEQVAELLEGNEDMYKDMIADMLDVDAEEIKSELGEESLNLVFEMKDFSKLKEIAELPDDTDLTYKTIVDSISSESEFACD